MAIDLSPLSGFTTAAGALANLIMINPQSTIGFQPQTKTEAGMISILPEPPKFLFHYEGENMISLASDITDHYIEDNTAINDQIALPPEKIKVTGFIGELNNVIPEEIALVKLAIEKLTALGAYAPELTVEALRVYNAALQGYSAAKSVANAGISAFASITGTGELTQITGTETPGELASLAQNNMTQTQQQIAFHTFYGYWRNRTLFTVQTPWAVFKNMAIESLVAAQTEETEVISSFEITFKLLRFAESAVALGPLNPTAMQGRAFDQASSLTSLGTSTPPPSIALSSVAG